MSQPEKTIRIVLVDDHAILQQGIASILREYPDLAVVGEATNTTDAWQLVESLLPDVLITDISMPDGSGYDLLERIQAKGLPIRVLFLTMHNKPEFISKAIQMGAAGYLTKDAVKDELVQAVRRIYRQQSYYGQSIMETLASGFVANKQVPDKSDLERLLSKREYEILTLIAEGLTTKQIADKLFLSERTVSNHRLNMFTKCEVSNAVELVKLYLRHKEV